MDRAYEGDELMRKLGYIPVVPQNATGSLVWGYDRTMYRRRNEVARLFRRLKSSHRIFSHFEKLSRAFINFALIVDAFR
jgi:predicted small integral membrane protein